MRSLFRIRFPDNVKDYLSTRAKDNDRSMNAELTNIMKKAMKEEPSPQTTTPRSGEFWWLQNKTRPAAGRPRLKRKEPPRAPPPAGSECLTPFKASPALYPGPARSTKEIAP